MLISERPMTDITVLCRYGIFHAMDTGLRDVYSVLTKDKVVSGS